jgi:hypothetical protein
MTTTGQTASSDPRPPAPITGSPPASVRVRLAEIALGAALSVDGVTGAATSDRLVGRVSVAGSTLPGVSAIALPGGLYELGLALVARPVPLRALAERVRERVAAGARTAGLHERLGPINVVFEDLADPGTRAGA